MADENGGRVDVKLGDRVRWTVCGNESVVVRIDDDGIGTCRDDGGRELYRWKDGGALASELIVIAPKPLTLGFRVSMLADALAREADECESDAREPYVVGCEDGRRSAIRDIAIKLLELVQESAEEAKP